MFAMSYKFPKFDDLGLTLQYHEERNGSKDVIRSVPLKAQH